MTIQTVRYRSLTVAHVYCIVANVTSTNLPRTRILNLRHLARQRISDHRPTIHLRHIHQKTYRDERLTLQQPLSNSRTRILHCADVTIRCIPRQGMTISPRRHFQGKRYASCEHDHTMHASPRNDKTSKDTSKDTSLSLESF